MAGNRQGGLITAKKNKEQHGEDFYVRIGAIGGSKSNTGGFASKVVGKDGLTGLERARKSGAIGGKKSKRRSMAIMNKSIRHGEIMLVPVETVPTGKTAKYDTYIVGHSETGHHHVLEAQSVQFEITEADKELYFRLFEPAKLVHKKLADRHKDLTIPAGTYKRYHDTEYDPFDKVIRDVAD